jgi:hypothetical protein
VARKIIPKTRHGWVRMIVKLVGFLTRKEGKEPGIKTLWIGIRRFTDIMRGWHIAKQKDVGKG